MKAQRETDCFWQMLCSMLMIGCIGFGGGNALIPVIYKRIVEDEKLISADEYESDVAVASITPGALPVEIAGGIGRRLCGAWGAFAGAAGMALPGAVFTVLGLTVYYLLEKETVLQIRYATVGVSAYIAYLLSGYVYKTFVDKKAAVPFLHKLLLVVAVFSATCGKNIYYLFGIKQTPLLGLATIHIFVLAFFAISFLQVKMPVKAKYVVTVVLCLVYVLCVMKTRIISDGSIFWLVKGIMAALAAGGIFTSLASCSGAVHIPWKECLKEIVILSGILLSAILMGSTVYTLALEFSGKGILSSLISFGGGDAYLAVADALFVEGGVLPDNVFYGELVPLVNILPGSILCKTMSGLGYLAGAEAGNVAACIMALVGFICSVVASCGVFSFVGCLYRALGELKLIRDVQRWIRPIVSGLMLTVILSLTKQVRLIDGSVSGWFFVALLAGIYLLNLAGSKYGITGVKCVIVDVIVALILCNCLY